MIRVKSYIFAVAVLVASFMAAPASAGPIVMDQWYTAHFGSTDSPILGGAIGTLGTNGPLPGGGFADSIYSSETPWTITVGAGGAYLTVVDLQLSGDRFEMLDFLSSLGTTSVPVFWDPDGSQCLSDIACALANSDFSRGSFFLAAGDHSLTGWFLGTVENGSVAFIVTTDPIVAPVPEPGTLVLLGAGIAVLAARRRLARGA